VLEPPQTYRPLGARVVAFVAGGALITVMAVLWAAMSADVRGQFNSLQTATLLLCLAVALTVLYGIARTSVRTDDSGITVRNGYRQHRLAWAEAVGVTLPRGAPWAVIDVADGSVLAAMALQGADGERARRAVAELRRSIDAHNSPEPTR